MTDVELADGVRRRFGPIGIDGDQLIVREIEREQLREMLEGKGIDLDELKVGEIEVGDVLVG